MSENKLVLSPLKFGSEAYHRSIALRDKILRKPLGLHYSDDFLQAEKDQSHLGLFLDGKLIGILLFKHEDEQTLKMRQVAIDEDFQGLGYGKKLVKYAEDFARQKGYRRISLHARLTAVPFYNRLGYKIASAEFVEVGLPHYKMEKGI